MKELDFDELDRAVNSLMTNVPKSDLPADESEKTLTIDSPASTTASLSSGSQSVVATSQNVDVRGTSSTPPETPSRAPLATRRGGRFMDVVHSSTDMKKPELSRPVSRQGKEVAPRPVAETADVSPTPQPNMTPTQVVTPTITEHPDAKSEWPDPLEMAEFKDAVTSTPESSLDTPTSSQDSDISQDTDTPLSSPFLPDAKVEKRPLGGALSQVPDTSDAPSNLLDTSQGFSQAVNDPTAQLPADPGAVEPALPAELQGDLVAIESGSRQHTPLLEATIEHAEEEPAPKAAPAAPQSTPQESVPKGPVSIPQQYREEPSTGDQDSGAIYDTDSYHQPLAHPAHKKSGWMWVVWIILILLLGAGVGAALYFFKIV